MSKKQVYKSQGQPHRNQNGWARKPTQTEPAVKSLEQGADLSFVDGSFIIKEVYGWMGQYSCSYSFKKLLTGKNTCQVLAFDLKNSH